MPRGGYHYKIPIFPRGVAIQKIDRVFLFIGGKNLPTGGKN
jgi:hypothetical protein